MMNPLFSLGKMVLMAGVLLIVSGGIMMFVSHSTGLGRLPGDIYIERKHVVFYVPLATSLIVSALLSLLVWLFTRT